MGMEYEKIHACPNDCILYRHDFQEMSKCPIYGTSWYKVEDEEESSSDENSNKGPPVKVLWYLPIIPRRLMVCIRILGKSQEILDLD